jgi:hypothetical protein
VTAPRPSAASSPLGRYDRSDGDAEPLVDIRLLRLPLLVHAASREHHDGLMREFRLMALSRQVPDQAAPTRLLQLVQVLGVQYAGAVARPDADIDEALDRGEDCMDVTYRVPVSAAAAAQALGQLMAEADDYCRSEELLTLARPPLARRFADWYLGQFVSQTAGGDPVAWDGPLSVD